MPITEPGRWFVSTSARPNATQTIMAIPQAGGGCSAFAKHAKMMPEWLDLATLSLPGRQDRLAEPLYTNLDVLTAELVGFLSARAAPFLLFGYCSGAVLAYAVACALADQGGPMPEAMIVGSYRPPHRIERTPLADLDSETFWKLLLEYRAVPPVLAGHAELRKLSEPVIRGDMALIDSYRHTDRSALPIPITVLAGGQDEWLTGADIEGWARYTANKFEVKTLPAGHWFMEEDEESAASALVAEAAKTSGQA